MLGKRTRFLTMMVAAVGIPYAWFNENLAAPVRNVLSTWRSEYSSPTEPGTLLPAYDGSWSSAAATLPAAAHPLPHFSPDNTSQSLSDVLRFDVSPRWVTQRWSRVSTVHVQPDLEGLRVPLVTGTGVNDILGSLTYYFDRQQHVRRITLHGHTGDERMLVALAAQRFGMKPEASLSAGIFLTRWNGQPVNVLRISHAPIIRAAAANTKFLVEMEVNDPSAGHGLSSDARQSLQYETHVRRWGD